MKSILENRPALAAEVDKVAEVAGYLWQKGWAERNGGNITVNITEHVDDVIRAMEPVSGRFPIGTTLPRLKGCYFFCKGTNKRMRDLARRPMENGSVIRILDDCASYEIIADKAVKPTSELASHLAMHNQMIASGNGYKAALHTHPIDLIAMTHNPAFLEKDVLTNLLWSMIPETRAFCPKGLGIVPYKMPSSVELAEATIAQIHALEAAGCEIVRVTVPTMEAAHALSKIKENISIPLVADIHFDYRLAVEAPARGADKIRINPGNIGDDDRVKAVVDACQRKNIPIRIGVNGGSLEKHILAKYGAPTPEAMVESALYHVRLLEKFDFNNIVISIKNSNVPRMMEAYRQLSAVTDYPLHVGVTEAGTYQMGLLKSGMGIGGMLLEGIGDTIRVSLAAEPEKEVEAGYNILRAVGFPVAGPEVITCPTCGRTQYPCTEIANEVEKRLQGCKKSIKVAVMGCVVNGPGEAREADIGIAGGKGEAVLFIHGKPIKKLTGDNILDQFMDEIYKL